MCGCPNIGPKRERNNCLFSKVDLRWIYLINKKTLYIFLKFIKFDFKLNLNCLLFGSFISLYRSMINNLIFCCKFMLFELDSSLAKLRLRLIILKSQTFFKLATKKIKIFIFFIFLALLYLKISKKEKTKKQKIKFYLNFLFVSLKKVS